MMQEEKLEQNILSLLEQGQYKTTTWLIQEFRAEYPDQWNLLEAEGAEVYGGGCGAHQLPATRIKQALFNLHTGRRVCRKGGRGGTDYLWSLAKKK